MKKSELRQIIQEVLQGELAKVKQLSESTFQGVSTSGIRTSSRFSPETIAIELDNDDAFYDFVADHDFILEDPEVVDYVTKYAGEKTSLIGDDLAEFVDAVLTVLDRNVDGSAAETRVQDKADIDRYMNNNFGDNWEDDLF